MTEAPRWPDVVKAWRRWVSAWHLAKCVDAAQHGGYSGEVARRAQAMAEQMQLEDQRIRAGLGLTKQERVH